MESMSTYPKPVLALLVVAFWVLVFIACSDPEPRVATPEEIARKAEDRRKGFHCLSGWDGSHRSFVNLVKRRMNDPDSFGHVRTRVTPVQSDTGRHSIIMEFRGRNAFGGIVKNTATGSYARDCSPSLDRISN